jgi:hypothetical protein
MLTAMSGLDQILHCLDHFQLPHILAGTIMCGQRIFLVELHAGRIQTSTADTVAMAATALLRTFSPLPVSNFSVA